MRQRRQKKPKQPTYDMEKIREISRQYAMRAAPSSEPAPVRPPEQPMTYVEYLRSPEWAMFKLSIVAKRGQQCERCDSRGKVDLHHRTYVNLFHEKPEDVELLCPGCHEEHHYKRGLRRRQA